MSSNDYQKLKSFTSRYQPKLLAAKNASQRLNQDLLTVIPDLPKHKFMKTVNLGSRSVTPTRIGTSECMQIVDHEEIMQTVDD